MQFINSFANFIFHLFPPGAMDLLANASLPNSNRAFKVFSKIKPKVFEYYSGKKMLFMFRKAARSVPAYKKFLQSQNVDPSEINSIEDFDKLVPRTTKENYIKAYSLSDRCVNGEFPQKGSFEESSGSSGTSTLWIRSLEEERYTMALMKASLLHLYGFREEDNFIVLNCFLLGGWTGGLRFASRISTLACVRNIGPDPVRVINCIKELGSGYTFLISGYPPFIVELIEFGKNLGNFDWKDYRIDIFAGGEGFVEEWREYTSSHLRHGALIFSDYGAIDLDVGISVETPFTVALRKLINNDTKLRKEVIGSERPPCFIGQCSPQQYYVRETINEIGIKELEITVMNLRSVSPNIKYVIGDEGGIIRFHELCIKLEKAGYPVTKIKHDFNIPVIIPFPVVYLYGRIDGSVSINGALISPSEIYKAILADPELVSAINTFKLSTDSDTDNFIKLKIFLETRKNVQITESLEVKCSDILIKRLLESNECFRIGFSKNPTVHKPVISIMPFGTGIFKDKNSTVKNVYTK